jgi:hypothetical protein
LSPRPALAGGSLEPVELERDVAVPVEAEPAERALDLLDRLFHLPARVRVLDAEEELSSLVPREEPVEERGADAADVEEPRRAGRKADADGHATTIAPPGTAAWGPARFLADEPGDREDDRGVEGIDELDERGHAAA